MAFCYLEMVRGSVVGRRYPVPDGAVSIGRSSQNTITLPPVEKSVSGHHAIIYRSSSRMLLQDLQSTNGTFVNETRTDEQDLNPGDVVGFGQSGPRLRVIVSETELDTSSGEAQREAFNEMTSIKTNEESAPIFTSKDATSNEERDTVERLAARNTQGPFDTAKPSRTTELEAKLIDRRIDADDMKTLMKQGDRLEKIVRRGNLGDTQTATLMTAYKAQRSLRRQMYYIIAAILFVSIAGISYFGIRSFQYKGLVTEAKTIKRDLDTYEKQIAEAKSDPAKNREEIESLIVQLEEKQKSLSTLKTRMSEDDFGEFYSDPLEKRIDDVLRRFGETDYHIPPEMVDRVRYHIDYYSGRLHETVGRYIQRRERYFPMIHRIFRSKNLPIELAYVSMLESGFNPNALSHAGARGLWQFMPQTARQFGLEVSAQRDERTDPEKATHAAAEYFKDLIGIFGGKSSVMLCMAAYNAGEGRVMGALRRIDDPMRNRDFWYIYRMGYLAEETNEYIPRVIAFIIISENPHDYGFSGAQAAVGDSRALESETDFVEFDYRVE